MTVLATAMMSRGRWTALNLLHRRWEAHRPAPLVSVLAVCDIVLEDLVALQQDRLVTAYVPGEPMGGVELATLNAFEASQLNVGLGVPGHTWVEHNPYNRVLIAVSLIPAPPTRLDSLIHAWGLDRDALLACAERRYVDLVATTSAAAASDPIALVRRLGVYAPYHVKITTSGAAVINPEGAS